MHAVYAQRRRTRQIFMAHVARVLALSLTLAMLFPAAAFARAGANPQPPVNPNEVTSAEFVENPNAYDGTTVTFEGEAIGDVMIRGDRAWIHINDDAYMYENIEEGSARVGYNSGLPVWVSAALASRIGVVGDYKHEGDVVQVRGVFNAACQEHGGDMDIHAAQLQVVVPGHDALDPVKPDKIVWAVVLTVLAATLWYAERRAGRREMQGRTT